MSINCANKSYIAATTVCAFYLAIYIGLGGLLFYLKVIHVGRNGDLFDLQKTAMRRYAFFVRGFKRNQYWWEFVMMAKKLSVICVISFASPFLTLVWASAFVMVFGYAHIITQPHVSDLVNRLEILAISTQYISILMGIHFYANKGDHVFAAFFFFVFNIGCTCVLVLVSMRRFRAVLMLVNEWLPKSLQLDYEKENTFFRENAVADTAEEPGGQGHHHNTEMSDLHSTDMKAPDSSVV